MSTAYASELPEDETGHRLEDIRHAQTLYRHSHHNRISAASQLAIMRSSRWRSIWRIVDETREPDLRAGYPWSRLQAEADWGNTDAAEMLAALEVARRLVEAEPDEPDQVTVRRLYPPDLRSFVANAIDPEWLVRGVMVQHQPMVFGGPLKCLKTSLLAELGISLATGEPFLSKFPIAQVSNVLFLSGESGSGTLARCLKVQCKAKGIDIEDLFNSGRFRIHDQLPRLWMESDLADLGEIIQELGITVVIIDPLYLCMVGANPGETPINMASMFEVGPALSKITSTCLGAGATPVLAHHFNRPASRENEMPDLMHLSHAGISEFARQYILVNRREVLDPSTGRHQLWFRVGGSAGFSGEYALDVEEGDLTNEDLSDRRWDVSIRPAHEARQETATSIQEQTAKKAVERHKGRAEAATKIVEDKILPYLEFIEKGQGVTTKNVRDHFKDNDTVASQVLAELQSRGSIVKGDVQRKTGTYDGWFPAAHLSRHPKWEGKPDDDGP